jgi:hypothetical protein
VFAKEENEIALLQTAIEHSQSWLALHANQRQNLLNFFLIAIAFLFNAYVGAVNTHRNLVAAVIGLLGAAISVGFTAMDLRNRDLTRAGEDAVKDLENLLAHRLGKSSLRIIEHIDTPRHSWLSHGKIIRTIHIIVGIVFAAATIYAFVT